MQKSKKRAKALRAKNARKANRLLIAAASNNGTGNLQGSSEHGATGIFGKRMLMFLAIVLMSVTKIDDSPKGKLPKKKAKPKKKVARKKAATKQEDEEDDEPKPIRLTKKQKEAIKKETKAGRLALSLLPPPPFTNIIPAPKLSKLNAVNLCNYVNDKFSRIITIPEFATCVPTVASVVLIYEALFPLASKNRKDVTGPERILLNMYKKQLRQQFTILINNCGTLSLGNLPLFSLTGVATKGNPVKHDGQPDTPSFRLDYTKGRGKLGVVITKVPNVKKYIVWYGKGDFDRAIWLSIDGATRQTIINQVPGELINVIVIAQGTKLNSEPSNPQGGNVPFN